jgi:hypothetical protein
VLAPAEALGEEDLVDPTPLDRDRLVLVEVGPEPVQRPAGEGQAQRGGVGQGRGDDLGDLLGRVGGRAARTRLIRQGGDALGVEASDPGVDGGARDAEIAGDGGDAAALAGRQHDPGPLDQAGLGGAGAGELFEFLPLRVGQLAELDLGLHGCLPGGLLVF